MTRGTTPIHNFILPFDTSEIYSVQVTYIQIDIDPSKNIMLTKSWSCSGDDNDRPDFDSTGIIFDGNEVRIRLTEADTYKFDPKHFLKIQFTAINKVRASIPSEDASGAYSETISVGEIYKSDVAYLAVLEDLAHPFPENPAKE